MKKEKKENPMGAISVEKVTLNIGAGKDQNMLKKGKILLKEITGIEPVETKAKKRIAAWALRPGLSIGAKITIRGKESLTLLKRLIRSKESRLPTKSFDENGNIAFGIQEYIDIPDTKYNPDIGIIGLEVCITLKKPGYRIKSKKIRPAKIGRFHKITKQDSIDYMSKEFGVKAGE